MVSVCYAQLHTMYTVYSLYPVGFNIQKSSHTKKQELRRNPTGKHGWPWGRKLIKHISLFFTSTQMNCVYWDEPTVAKSVMWLRYGISNRGTPFRFPAQAQFIATAMRPSVSGTTQLPTQRLPGAVSPSVQRPGRVADHWRSSKWRVSEWVELYLHSHRGLQNTDRGNFMCTARSFLVIKVVGVLQQTANTSVINNQAGIDVRLFDTSILIDIWHKRGRQTVSGTMAVHAESSPFHPVPSIVEDIQWQLRCSGTR